jgi:catechol 2,3-dioxygenase-like lactoylglutathione lyase family enzyme
VGGFNHLGHCVTDVARAERFYTELLGFTRQRTLEVPDGPAGRLLRVEAPVGLSAVYLERDGFVLELLHFDRPGNPPARERPFTEPGLTHLSFTVDDLDGACARVAELGGEVLDDTNLGVAVMVRDPDGQLVELLRAPAP